jgi:hypothetical protein
MAVDRDVIEERLDKLVRDYLAEFGRKDIVPGWRALSMFGFQTKKVGEGQISYLEGEPLERLLSLTGEWQDAFDAAAYLAAQALAAGIDLPPSLRIFAAEVLLGDKARPVRKGRPLEQGKLLALWQISLVYFLHEKAGLPIARNRENSHSGQFNACEAVATAFCRAGKHTTFEKIAGLIYDSGYSDLRDTAKVIKLWDV